MSTNMKQEIEVRGATVDDAIAEGLKKLGVARADVIIDVIDEGSRGLLGLGARDAVVRLVSMAPTPEVEVVTEDVVTEVVQETAVSESAPVETQNTEQIEISTSSISTDTEADTEPDDEERDVAVEVVEHLIKEMQVQATISTIISEPDDITGERINIIEIHGDDLGVLIGPRGETLNALQYVTRLIVGHRLHRRTNFVIDIAGYRQRRELALTRLAERMANKVVKRGRPVSLEPMPPHERRIIHMTLRENDAVRTNSVGEGKRRKVRILPN